MTETFYDVLGVDPDATQDEITEAYRRRVKETHPDLNDSADAAEAFQRVGEAEAVLGDPDERARYDRLGHATYQRMFGGPGGRTGDGPDGSGDRTAGDDDGGRTGTDRDWTDDARGNRNRRREYPGSDREATGDGNRTNRSYYVGDAGAGGGGTASGANAGSGPSGGGSTGAPGASTDGGATATGSSFDAGAARRKTRGEGEHVAGEDDEWDGFSVRDWNEDELEQEPVRVSLSQQSLVLATLTFLMYPFLAYVTVSPSVGLLVNVVIGACTLLLLGYLLTIPRIAAVGFGTLSLGLPLVLAFVGVDLLAPMSVFLVAACVVPFWYAMAFRYVVD